MKTDLERDLIDYPISIKQARSRLRKIQIIRDFEQKHGTIPSDLLHALGHSEFSRGWAAGADDATGWTEDA